MAVSRLASAYCHSITTSSSASVSILDALLVRFLNFLSLLKVLRVFKHIYIYRYIYIYICETILYKRNWENKVCTRSWFDWDRDRDACGESKDITQLCWDSKMKRCSPFDMHRCRNPEEDA